MKVHQINIELGGYNKEELLAMRETHLAFLKAIEKALKELEITESLKDAL